MGLVPKSFRPPIVVCSHDDAFRRVFGSYARAQGCEVREAVRGAAVLHALDGAPPAGLVIELALPGDIDGYHVLRRVHRDRRLRGMRVVAMAPAAPTSARAAPRGVHAHEVLHRPLPPGAVLRQLLADQPRPPPEPLCVFVVEDHDDTRDMLVEALGAAGVQAFGFATAEHVLLALRAIRPTALLTDYTLSDLDGEELARRARALVPGLPVLVLTGHAHVARACTEFDGAFLKPFDLDEVVAAIRELDGAPAPHAD